MLASPFFSNESRVDLPDEATSSEGRAKMKLSLLCESFRTVYPFVVWRERKRRGRKMGLVSVSQSVIYSREKEVSPLVYCILHKEREREMWAAPLMAKREKGE